MKLSKATRERLTAWWEHRPTGRPCILATSPCGDPGPAPAPDDYWTKPELLADCVLARQRAVRFWGEAMPFLYMDYGAPAMALQMGAKASWTSVETLWADPCVETADEVAALRPGGYWKEIQDRAIREGISRCSGSAMLASYCLGASADTTAALMGSENLLCALIEDEEGVKRAFEAVKRIMIDAFSALAAQCEQGGTQLTGWHGIWSPGATTAIQEDFSYMIGADMFDGFCLPHIRDMVDAVPYAFYHLDGAQALRHLPSLCKIPNLRVIQWQPGDGHSAILQWTDVIRTILDSGKSCQIYARPEEVEPLVREVGGDGLMVITWGSEEEISRLAERFDLDSRGFEPPADAESFHP